MADEQVASEAKARGVTRAVVSMEHAAKFEGPLIFAIGNAPTALIRLHELIEEGIVAPALVIGVPVGFVNVVEAKELFIGGDTPYIIARGREGGSNVAASIVNALLYQMVHREGFYCCRQTTVCRQEERTVSRSKKSSESSHTETFSS